MKKLLFTLSLLIFPLAAHAQFTDTQDHTYQEAINYAQENGIVNGYSDGSFKPDNQINRAEFVKIIIEAEFTAEEIASCDLSLLDRYTDLNQEEWYAPFICLATDEGIIEGYPDGSFKPEQMVNFTEAAKIIIKARNQDIEEDEEIWYKNFVQKLSDQYGIPPSIKKLDQYISRAEMVEIIWRLKLSINTPSSMIFRNNKLLSACSNSSSYNYYFTENDYVCFGHDKTSIDPESYTILGSSYAKDHNNVYHDGKLVPGANPNTFEVIEKCQANENLVGKILPADNYAQDEENIYWSGEMITADHDSFSVINCSYGKDKDFIYTWGRKRTDLDSQTFQLLDQGFSKDQYRVYYSGKEIIDADVDTFEVLGGTYYAKDKNNVYQWQEKVEDLNPDTFDKVLYSQDNYKYFYYKYDGQIYTGSWQPLDVDANSFTPLKYLYSKDKNHVYYQNKTEFRIIEEVNPDNFIYIGKNYYRSGNDIYRSGGKEDFVFSNYNYETLGFKLDYVASKLSFQSYKNKLRFLDNEDAEFASIEVINILENETQKGAIMRYFTENNEESVQESNCKILQMPKDSIDYLQGNTYQIRATDDAIDNLSPEVFPDLNICGQYASEGSNHFFFHSESAPNKVFYLDLGQKDFIIPLIDLASIESL
jgi:predicted DNA-binding antitoxin AbrB/MazE fold protein